MPMIDASDHIPSSTRAPGLSHNGRLTKHLIGTHRVATTAQRMHSRVAGLRGLNGFESLGG